MSIFKNYFLLSVTPLYFRQDFASNVFCNISFFIHFTINSINLATEHTPYISSSLYSPTHNSVTFGIKTCIHSSCLVKLLHKYTNRKRCYELHECIFWFVSIQNDEWFLMKSSQFDSIQLMHLKSENIIVHLTTPSVILKQRYIRQSANANFCSRHKLFKTWNGFV